MYIDILAQLVPNEAAILDTLYSVPSNMESLALVTKDLSDSVIDMPDDEDFELNPDLNLALIHLDSLNLIFVQEQWDDMQNMKRVKQTVFGKSFIEACKMQDS